MRKRANGEGNIIKRSNGTREARSIYGKTQKEVRDKPADLQSAGIQQMKSLPDEPCLLLLTIIKGNNTVQMDR